MRTSFNLILKFIENKFNPLNIRTFDLKNDSCSFCI